MTGTLEVALSRLPHGEGLDLPGPATAGAAGVDLAAAIAPDVPLAIPPGGRAIVPTGFRIALPPGYEAQIRSRSGLAARYGVAVLNAPGTIDADYRGEISVVLVNHGAESFTVRRGDRIAQMLIAPVLTPRFILKEILDETERGEKGYGSTGWSAQGA